VVVIDLLNSGIQQITWSHEISLSLSILRAISRWTWVSWYQNVSILDFIGANGNGATRRAKLQSKCHHQQTNAQFLQAGCPSCHPNKCQSTEGTQ